MWMKHNSPKASVKTLGCRLNQYEGLALEAKLRNAGYEVVPFGEPADVGVVNTCTVTNEADAKSRNAIRRFIRGNPNALTIVAGCYSQISANEAAMIKGVDYVIGNHDKLNFLDYLADQKPTSPVIIRDKINKDDFSIGFVGESRFEQRANLKVQDGCDFMCSFCVIPFARGRARSRDLNDLISEAKTMIASGVREIVLTGVNIGDFGTSHGETLLDLVRALDDLEGVERFRISSIEPNLLTDELIDFVGGSRRFQPHFHIPLQSGADDVLSAMRRRYRTNLYASRIQRIKTKMPEASIGVDVIVGFPGESDDHFMQTVDFIKSLEISYLHVFTYSERPNTTALRIEDVVPISKRKERNKTLRNLSLKAQRAHYEEFLGRTVPVLFEDAQEDGLRMGYTPNYIRVAAPANLVKGNDICQVTLDRIDPLGWVHGTLT